MERWEWNIMGLLVAEYVPEKRRNNWRVCWSYSSTLKQLSSKRYELRPGSTYEDGKTCDAAHHHPLFECISTTDHPTTRRLEKWNSETAFSPPPFLNQLGNIVWRSPLKTTIKIKSKSAQKELVNMRMRVDGITIDVLSFI
jgi:hypothetical protein